MSSRTERPDEAPDGVTPSALATTMSPSSPRVSAPGGQVPPSTVLSGRYEILGLLGSGGMGCVYRARDRELDEAVALKMLHRELFEEMRERFRREVRLARRITHRNIARTFDIGEHDGAWFLTMELVEGEPLSARMVRRGALPLAEVVATARQVCEGLDAAHAVGVVHRDLKPDNVLIEPAGRVVITDFGIARAADCGAPTQTAGRAVGTPAYMAPEQVEGRGEIDARADLYAFGAMLYEMCTGSPAWPGDSAVVVAAARLLQPPPDPRDRQPSLDEAMAALVRRCMARDPADRPASARAVREALDAVEARLPRAAPAPEPSGPSPRVEALPRRERSVAVLPFRNQGSDDDAHWAEGLREDLTDALATAPGLRVSARRLAATQEAWREHGIDVVVEGSVRRRGDTLRVSARLIGVGDGYQIWAGRFERPIASAFALNDEVAAAIMAALSARQDVRQRQKSVDPRAIELYFRAHHEVAMFWSSSSERALALLEQAFDLAPDDPTIVAAYAGASVKHAAFNGGAPDPRLAQAVDRALAAGPHLGEPWVALANLRGNALDDTPGAARALRRAVQLSPSLADGYDLAGRLLLEAGELDEALACLDRALWIDPLLPFARIDRARAAALEGRWDEAASVLEARQDAPWKTQIYLSQLRFSAWRSEPLPEMLIALPPDTPAPVQTVVRLFVQAREAKALTTDLRTTLDAFLSRPAPRSRGRRFFCQMAAEIAGSQGAHEAVLDYTRQAVEHGMQDLHWMRRMPLLDGCRQSPAFAPLLAQVEQRARAVVDAWRAPDDDHLDDR